MWGEAGWERGSTQAMGGNMPLGLAKELPREGPTKGPGQLQGPVAPKA